MKGMGHNPIALSNDIDAAASWSRQIHFAVDLHPISRKIYQPGSNKYNGVVFGFADTWASRLCGP